MKTIERYVFGSFLSSFVLAFLVLSFVLTIGLLVQIVGYIMDGVPMRLVGEFAMVSLPETLQWSVPLSLLVSAILVFSRLSADGEIAAMRACGVHLASVVRWPAAFAVLCTLVGFYVNNEVVPRGHEVRRTLKTRVSVGAGLSVLEPGRVIDDFPRVKLYFGSKNGNWLHDFVALDYSNPKVDRMITAEKALVAQQGRDVSLELYGMTVDPLDESHPTMARFSRFAYVLKDVLKEEKYHRRAKDLAFRGLLGEISRTRAEIEKVKASPDEKGMKAQLVEYLRRQLSSLKVELAKRFAFALASICFVLVGVPLGIRSQRKESTIGMAISLAVALGYYMVVILMLSFEERYRIHPEALIFLPALACVLLGGRLLRRHL